MRHWRRDAWCGAGVLDGAAESNPGGWVQLDAALGVHVPSLRHLPFGCYRTSVAFGWLVACAALA